MHNGRIEEHRRGWKNLLLHVVEDEEKCEVKNKIKLIFI